MAGPRGDKIVVNRAVLAIQTKTLSYILYGSNDQMNFTQQPLRLPFVDPKVAEIVFKSFIFLHVTPEVPATVQPGKEVMYVI
jgi:hypothetical protein